MKLTSIVLYEKCPQQFLSWRIKCSSVWAYSTHWARVGLAVFVTTRETGNESFPIPLEICARNWKLSVYEIESYELLQIITIFSYHINYKMSKNAWAEYKSIYGHTLFIYNKITGEHKWPSEESVRTWNFLKLLLLSKKTSWFTIG